MRVTRRNQPSVWTFQSNWNTSHTHTQHFGAAFKYSPKSSPTRISSYLPTNASLVLDTKVKTHSLTWSCWSPLHSTWLEADPGGKITLFNAYYIDLLRNSCNLDGIEMNSGNTHHPNPGLLAAGLWLHYAWSRRLIDSTFIWGTPNTPTPLLEGLYARYCQVTEKIPWPHFSHPFLISILFL